MKKLIFGLLVAVIAFGGSAFKNVDAHSKTDSNKKFYDDGYLVQSANGVWTHVETADINDGDCTIEDNEPCKFLITSTIPTQGSYNSTQVTSTYAASLDEQEQDGDFLYVVPQ
jgi:hypothetical protein